MEKIFKKKITGTVTCCVEAPVYKMMRKKKRKKIDTPFIQRKMY